MHRAFGRVIRGTCRKWRENEVPTVAGEEVRKNQDKKDEKFTHPRTASYEALGWTTGLFVSWGGYERYRRSCDAAQNAETKKEPEKKQCPFSFTRAIAQPLLPSFSTASYVNPSGTKKSALVKSTAPKRSSIDTPVFLPEELLLSESDRSSFSEDDSVVWEDLPAHVGTTSTTQSHNSKLESSARRFAGDILNVLGATQLTHQYSKGKGEPPVTAAELLKKAADLGSGRALYNLGVMYDREDDKILAKEYYQRASDLGHPLACFNYAAMIRNEERKMTSEAQRLMAYAAKHGVPEAKEWIDRALD